MVAWFLDSVNYKHTKNHSLLSESNQWCKTRCLQSLSRCVSFCQWGIWEEKNLLDSFRGGSTRECIAALAFWMGINDIVHVIHWGPTNDDLDYWQGVGHCGCDGRQGYAYMYSSAGKNLKSSSMPSMRKLMQAFKAKPKGVSPLFVLTKYSAYLLGKEDLFLLLV